MATLSFLIILGLSLGIATGQRQGPDRPGDYTTEANMSTGDHHGETSGFPMSSMRPRPTTHATTRQPVTTTMVPMTTMKPMTTTPKGPTTTAASCHADWRPCGDNSHCCSGFCVQPPWGCSICLPTMKKTKKHH